MNDWVVFIATVLGTVILTLLIEKLIRFIISRNQKHIDQYQVLNKSYTELSTYIDQANIVFVGDSITEQYHTTDFHYQQSVINRGIGGDRTEGLLNRLHSNVLVMNPNNIILLIGINDLQGGIEVNEVFNNIQTIIKTIKAYKKDCNIYIESVYPINEIKNVAMVGRDINDKVIELNKNIKKYACENNIKYIDVNTHLQDETGALNLQFSEDGLHLNFEGYKVVTKVLKENCECLNKEN